MEGGYNPVERVGGRIMKLTYPSLMVDHVFIRLIYGGEVKTMTYTNNFINIKVPVINMSVCHVNN
jgi:hypothetical protein